MYQQYRPQRFSFLPDVVKNLLIINILCYVATLILLQRGIDLRDMLGLHYYGGSKFRWWQFFTYMFMHGNFFHLLFNMFALWMFGTAVENLWGAKRFLNYYIFCGLGAAATHYAMIYYSMNPGIAALSEYIAHPSVEQFRQLMGNQEVAQYLTTDELHKFQNSFNYKTALDLQAGLDWSVRELQGLKETIADLPNMIGASGAVFGILLAFGLNFPNAELIMLPIPFPIKAKYAVVIYAVIELVQGTKVVSFGEDNVAHFAHLGGLIFGLILILIWRNQNRSRRNDFYNP